MDVLVITLQQNQVPLAYFRFGASIHALSILEQLDFKEGTPVFPDGTVMTPEEIAQIKEVGIVIPRTVTTDTNTLLRVLAMMDPYKPPAPNVINMVVPSMEEMIAHRKAEERGRLFSAQRRVIEGAVAALKNDVDISVSMSLTPMMDEFHDPSDNGYGPEDDK